MTTHGAFGTMAAKEKKMKVFNNLTVAAAAAIFGLSLGVNAFGNVLKFYYFHKVNITPELLMLDIFIVAAIILFYRVLR